MKTTTADLCIIGAGSGGLSVAAAASQMGLNVVLIEKHKMGGDCLNYGCVPSKALLAAAKCADTLRHADQFGIQSVDPDVDYKKLNEHIRDVIAAISPHDSVERFTGLGVNVILGTAHFVNRNTVEVNGEYVSAKRFVIATGGRAAVPPISGLEYTPYMTNETVFDLTEKPEHLIVIGGGPIGCELAQAYALLGAKVTMLEGIKLLPKDDPECVEVIRQRLKRDGIAIYEGINVVEVSGSEKNITVTIEENGKQQQIYGTHLLLATGRRPNFDELDCEKADIETDKFGVIVDARLRSSNKKIYAIGDVARSFQFTHTAGYHAGIVIRNAVFHLPTKVNNNEMPWVTYTEPEMAHVGLNEQMASENNLKFNVIKMPVNEIDRNQTERRTEGLIKVIVTPKGNVLGATIVGDEAGELIFPWCLAIQNKLKLSALASAIVPYPTRNDITKRVAGNFYTSTLYSPKVRKLVRFLSKF